MKRLNNIQLESDSEKSKRLNFAFKFRIQKKYIFSKIGKFIKGKTLEVGSGVGGNLVFIQKKTNNLHALEPSEITFKELLKNRYEKKFNDSIILHNLFLKDLNIKFDTIIYIDVLEHIENDSDEINEALKLLKNDGNLIILCPAYNFLYLDEFDQNVGHFRRYNYKLYLELANEANAKIEKIFYLDSCGFFLSFLNKFLFKQKDLTKGSLWIYNFLAIPVSYILDYLFMFSFGKSIVMVLKKNKTN